MVKQVLQVFLEWTKIKVRIHSKPKLGSLYFREKEIWWVHLGKNIGYEEDGKHESFERPMIVLRKFNRHLFLGVPTSTRLKPQNSFYHPFLYKGKQYSALLCQLRATSSKRLIRRIGSLPIPEFRLLQERIVRLLKYDSRTNK